MGADIDGPMDSAWFGRGVALLGDGSRLAIGAPHKPSDTTQTGEVRLFAEVNGVWVQTGPTIFGEALGDYGGQGLTFNHAGDRLAIGAHWNDGNGPNSGHVRVYHLDFNTAIQEDAELPDFHLMPVPTAVTLFVQAEHSAEIHLFDLTGALALTQRLQNGTTAIDVSTLARGAYIAELRSRDATPSRFAKVILE